MTAPISHGYPDFGRYIATADKLISQVTGNVIDAVTTHGRFFVGDVSYLVIFMTTSINHAQWRIRFWDSATGGNLLAGHTFSIRATGNFDGSVSVLGPWVEIQVTPSAVDTEYTYIMSTAHRPVFNNVNSATDPVLLAANSNIGAGASLTVTATRIWPGEAHWFTESAVATWTSRVETIDYLGTAIIIDEMRKVAAGDDGRRIFLPPCNIQMVVTNQSGGAGTFRFAVVARPIEPGR